jgi:hypothetical protein
MHTALRQITAHADVNIGEAKLVTLVLEPVALAVIVRLVVMYSQLLIGETRLSNESPTPCATEVVRGEGPQRIGAAPA